MLHTQNQLPDDLRCAPTLATFKSNFIVHGPGPERVFASLRRNYWILLGRQAARKHQHACVDCKKWKAKPLIPQMADLRPSCLRLFKPPFWSTGMDCFGHFSNWPPSGEEMGNHLMYLILTQLLPCFSLWGGWRHHQVVYAYPDLLGTRRWPHSQVLADKFRFVKYYLPTLQSRQKWKVENPNLTLNAMVMFVDPNLPCLMAKRRSTETSPKLRWPI